MEIETLEEAKELIRKLTEQRNYLTDRLIAVKENVGLQTCRLCKHLHMYGHICYQCGHDNSISDFDQLAEALGEKEL